MAITLSPTEQRVLGVLIEKAMTTPQYYPMTLNAVTAACNQKNNRDPVLTLSEGEVGAALHELQRWQLVSQPGPEPGSRANKFRHEVEKKFGWSAAQRAVMCELLIRGPQTLGELRTNTARMKQETLESLREVIAELERADPPMVRELPRQPGRRENRFAQLLSGEPVETADPTPGAVATASLASPGQGQPLAARVEALEQTIATLRNELEVLRAELRAGRGG